MNKQPVFLFLLVIASLVLAGCSGVASAKPLPAVETQSDSSSDPLRTISVAGSGRTTISPDIAINASGTAIVVWAQSDGTQDNIWAKRFTPGVGWGLAQLIENEGGKASSPRIDINSAGDAMAVWYHNNGARENIWAARFTPGSGWEEAQLIENNNAGNAFDPQLGLDPSGNAIVVWHQHDGLRNNIYANRYD